MCTRWPIHHAFARDDRTEWNTRGNSFCAGDDVWFNIPMVASPPFSGSAQTALNFISDKKYSVLVTQLTQRWKETIWGNDVSAFALDRLNQNAGTFISGDKVSEDYILDILNDCFTIIPVSGSEKRSVMSAALR